MKLDKMQEKSLMDKFIKLDQELFDTWMLLDNTYNFQEFTKLNSVNELSNNMLEILNKLEIKTTYNNLTNRNDHLLVAVLLFNWFFDKTLNKNEVNEIKEIVSKKYTEYKNKL